MFKASKVSFFLTICYTVLVVWWVFNFFSREYNTINTYLYGLAYSLLPFIGGLLGLRTSSYWGGFKSYVGSAVFYISLGLITWSIGGVIFAYYNLVLGVEVPYPSLADFAYIISWPLWAFGMFYLSRATGARYGIGHWYGKLIAIIVPIASLFLTYYLVVYLANGGSFDLSAGGGQLFFSLAYPFGDVVILTLTLVIFGLSLGYLGGKFTFAIVTLLLSFVFNYISDMSFSYTTALGTFYTGNWVDLLFTTTMFLMSLGVNLLTPINQKATGTQVKQNL